MMEKGRYEVVRIGGQVFRPRHIRARLAMARTRGAFCGSGGLDERADVTMERRPTRVLVTTGIHGWTRNPIYLGMFLVYAGIGIAARSPWTLLLTLPRGITIR